MSHRQLGRLEKAVLSELWGGNTREFVDWLQHDENLSVLGVAIGRALAPATDVPLELARNADLCCRDAETGALLIASVSFEDFSDAQVGELLSAAVGQPEAILVWLAAHISDRHKAVIDWLNEITAEKLACYGLEMTFWQIGKSALAPTITTVCKPSGVSQRVSSSFVRRATAAPIAAGQPAVVPSAPAPAIAATSAAIAPVARSAASSFPAAAPAALPPLAKPPSIFLEYWLSFNGNLIQRKSPVIGQKPTAANWTSFPLNGAQDFNLVATVNNRDHFIAVAFVMSGPDSKRHFHLLHQYKAQIENEIGSPLEWQELQDKTESRILLRRFGVDPENRRQWQEQHDWLAEKLERFQRAFSLRVEALHSDELADPGHAAGAERGGDVDSSKSGFAS